MRAFVYGAQMTHPASLEAAWPGRVRDHAVRFVARGLPVFEPVFAALEPAPGETAYGVVVDFDDETWARLVVHERSYEPREVEVELLAADDIAALGGPTLHCAAFILVRERRPTPGRPSARYAGKLAAGARRHGLPEQVIARYEQAAAEGGRASLAFAWLFPLASRIGLVPTAILVLGSAALALGVAAAAVLGQLGN